MARKQKAAIIGQEEKTREVFTVLTGEETLYFVERAEAEMCAEREPGAEVFTDNVNETEFSNMVKNGIFSDYCEEPEQEPAPAPDDKNEAYYEMRLEGVRQIYTEEVNRLNAELEKARKEVQDAHRVHIPLDSLKQLIAAKTKLIEKYSALSTALDKLDTYKPDTQGKTELNGILKFAFLHTNSAMETREAFTVTTPEVVADLYTIVEDRLKKAMEATKNQIETLL